MINSCFKTNTSRGIAVAAALCCMFLPASQGIAASSNWVDTDGGRIRLSTLDPTKDGQIRAVLDVDLLPGWKTYWRDPGEAGVPPTIQVGESVNINDAEIHFPAPERIEDAYSIWAGYDYPVLFPITLKQSDPGAASVLEADVFLGICKSICIPFQTSFTVKIDPDTPANAFEERLVKRAFEALPEQAGHGFDIVEHEVGDGGKSLILSVVTPKRDYDGELFVTGPPGWRFNTPQITSHDGNVVTYQVEANGNPEGETLNGAALRLLVKASGRSMETDLVLK